MKKVIRLTESDLHRIVKESVQKILKEDFDFDMYELSGDDYNEWEVSECSKFTEYFVPGEGLTNDETDPDAIPVPITIYPIVEIIDNDFEIKDFEWEFDTNNKETSDKLSQKYGSEIDNFLKANFKTYKYYTEIKIP